MRRFVLLLSILALPLTAGAQQSYTPPGSDTPSKLNENPINLVLHPSCLTDIPNGGVGRSCLSDAPSEDQQRQKVSAMDRTLKAGVLTIATIWTGIESLKNIISTGHGLFTQLDAAMHGFDATRSQQTLLRIADATDASTQQLASTQDLTLQLKTPFDNPRYSTLQGLVVRAMGKNREDQDRLLGISDQIDGLQMSLAGGNTTIRMISTSGTASSPNAPPPLPSDAPPEAYTEYASEMPDSGTGLMAAARIKAPGSGLLKAAMFKAAGGPGSDALTCQVADDKTGQATEATYRRADVQLLGAENEISATTNDATATSQELQATVEREKENRYIHMWQALYKMFHLF